MATVPSTPPAPVASVPAAAPSEASLLLAKEKAIKEELAKLPSVETLEEEISAIERKKAELMKLQDVKLNFGPGLKGKKAFKLPKMPISMGNISVNGRIYEGVIELTHEEWQNYVSIMDLRIEHEQKMRYGEGINERELAALAGGAVSMGRTGESAKF